MVPVAGFQVTLPPAACRPYQIHAHIQRLHRQGADSQVTIRFCLPQSLPNSAKECASLPPSVLSWLLSFSCNWVDFLDQGNLDKSPRNLEWTESRLKMILTLTKNLPDSYSLGSCKHVWGNRPKVMFGSKTGRTEGKVFYSSIWYLICLLITGHSLDIATHVISANWLM